MSCANRDANRQEKYNREIVAKYGTMQTTVRKRPGRSKSMDLARERVRGHCKSSRQKLTGYGAIIMC
jgi:hypothetical protein